MPESIIAVRGISKNVQDASGRLDILRDIDFSLNAGETAAIVGASGSGKSTLLAILAGLDTPSAGQVVLAGQSLFDLSEDERAALRAQHVGFVFQSFPIGWLHSLTAHGGPYFKTVLKTSFTRLGTVRRIAGISSNG